MFSRKYLRKSGNILEGHMLRSIVIGRVCWLVCWFVRGSFVTLVTSLKIKVIFIKFEMLSICAKCTINF